MVASKKIGCFGRIWVFRRQKETTTVHLVQTLRNALLVLGHNETIERKKKQKAMKKVSTLLKTIKTMLFETKDPVLAEEIYRNNLLSLLVENLKKVGFKERNDAAHIFVELMKTKPQTVDHIWKHHEIIAGLLCGHEDPEIAFTCGTILRECLHHEVLARLVLHSQAFYKLFDYVEMSSFDVVSNAFITIKDLLFRHQMLTADFLDSNYDSVFSHFNRLLKSVNYVTKRQSLKLLCDVLLTSHNYVTIIRYINDFENLKTVMTLLTAKRRRIQFEAFHVFKAFAMNPNMASPIEEILACNCKKLIAVLTKFRIEHWKFEQIQEEVDIVIESIQSTVCRNMQRTYL